MTIGLFVLRLALGGALILQGWAKLTRQGRTGTATFFADIGFQPAARLALVAGVTEVSAGGLLVVGLGTWLAAAGVIGVLVGAAAVCWERGYWNSNGGAEYPIVAGLTAAGLAFTGAGAFSVDAVLGWSDVATATSVSSVILGVGAALPLLIQRQRTLRRRASTAPVQLAEAA